MWLLMNVFEILSELDGKPAEMIEREMREAVAELQRRMSGKIILLCEGCYIKPVDTSSVTF